MDTKTTRRIIAVVRLEKSTTPIDGYGKGRDVEALAVVMKLLSDQKSLELFDTIATEDGINRSESLRVKLKLTKKPHYSRISALVKSGLVKKRQDHNYYLTTFGHIIYQVLLTMQGAMDECWKLKAIDSLNNNIPAQERKAMIDSMISNEKIKELLDRMN